MQYAGEGQEKMSKKNIITVERLPGGKVIQVMPNGSKRPLEDETDWTRLHEMTEEEIEAGALADPDNPPDCPLAITPYRIIKI